MAVAVGIAHRIAEEEQGTTTIITKISIATIISVSLHLLRLQELSTRFTRLTLSLISSPSKPIPVTRAPSTRLLHLPLPRAPPLLRRHHRPYRQVPLLPPPPPQRVATVSAPPRNLTLTLSPPLLPILLFLHQLALFLLVQHTLQLSTNNLTLH